MSRRWYPRDAQLTLLSGNATAITADDDDGIGASPIIDLGSGRFDACLVLDIAAIDVASSDESYDLIIQGSNSATFASGIQELARRRLGHTSTLKGAASSAIGRYELPFTNDVLDTEYRYLRVLVDVAGTSPSITIRTAWFTKDGAL